MILIHDQIPGKLFPKTLIGVYGMMVRSDCVYCTRDGELLGCTDIL